MTFGHRTAHLKAVFAGAVLAGGVLFLGWTARAARPVPQPLSAVAPSEEEPAWELTVETHAGPARLALIEGETGDPVLRVSLPPGLDAAEPGLLIEAEGMAPRVLGSISPARPVIRLSGGLPGGGRIVLVDLARDIRLGEARVPGGGP